jgi:hypothetical protein
LCDESDWEHGTGGAGGEVVLGNNRRAVSRPGPTETVSHKQFHFCRRNCIVIVSTDLAADLAREKSSTSMNFFYLELAEGKKVTIVWVFFYRKASAVFLCASKSANGHYFRS